MSGKETIEQSVVAEATDPIEWFERYGDYLFAFARRRVREQSAAEDIVQETFLAAIQARPTYTGRSAEKTWLTGILKHKIYDYFRKNSRQTELSREEADFSGYDYLFERGDEWNRHWNNRYAPAEWTETSPVRRVEAVEFQTVLYGCLTGLPERIANAFVMRAIDEMNAAEICDVLMISPKNYWTMMYRARLHLRRCIEVNWFLVTPTK